MHEAGTGRAAKPERLAPLVGFHDLDQVDPVMDWAAHLLRALPALDIGVPRFRVEPEVEGVDAPDIGHHRFRPPFFCAWFASCSARLRAAITIRASATSCTGIASRASRVT